VRGCLLKKKKGGAKTWKLSGLEKRPMFHWKFLVGNICCTRGASGNRPDNMGKWEIPRVRRSRPAAGMQLTNYNHRGGETRGECRGFSKRCHIQGKGKESRRRSQKNNRESLRYEQLQEMGGNWGKTSAGILVEGAAGVRGRREIKPCCIWIGLKKRLS